MIQNETVNKAISYILSHIWEPITLEEVAEYCNISKFYFSRMFKSETGESVYSFIKRIKLEQSALRLKLETQKSITDIGLDYGYSSSNYSSAFKKHHHLSPYEFRKKEEQNELKNFESSQQTEDEIFEEINKQIIIKILPDYKVIYERKIGNYNEMSIDWSSITEKYQSIINDKTIFFERTFDDPTITDKNHCIYDICISAPENCTLPNTSILTGGKFAIFPFKGYIKDIQKTHILLIRNIWFPRSGFELDSRYSYDLYHYVDCETMYMEFDICIPIK